MRSLGRSILPILGIAFLATCGGGGTEPSAPAPVGFVFVVPPQDTVADHSILAPAPLLQLVDAEGAPVHQAGVSVNIQSNPAGLVVAGCGLGFARVSDDQGLVSFTGCRAQGTSGRYTLKFTPTGFPVLTHPLILLPGAGASLSSGALPANAPAGATVPSIEIWLADSSGNHVPGIAFALAVNGGVGSVTGPVVSGAGGNASITNWKVDTLVGVNDLTVTPIGLPGIAPLHLQVAGVAGPPSHISLDSTWTGPLPIDTVLANPITVTATDAYGNPTAGLLATFFVYSDPSHNGGYVMTGGQFPMDGTGTATLPSLHTERRSGRYEFLVALGPGSTGWLVFGGYTLHPGVPAFINGAFGVGRGPVGVPQIAAVYVGDQSGNPSPTALTVNVTQGGGSVIADSTLYLDTNYQAVHWTFGVAGPQQIVISAPMLPGATVTLNSFAVAPVAILPTSGAGQAGPIGGLLPIQPVFRVVDSAGSGVDSVPVRILGGGAAAGNYTSDSGGYVHVGNAQFEGPPGARQIRAISSWVPGDTAQIGLTSTIGPPSGIDPVSVRSAVIVGSSTDSVARFKVHDASGYGVGGVVVRFAVSSGGFVVDSTVTDTAGIAVTPVWVAGTVKGDASITAIVGAIHRDVVVYVDPGPVAALSLADGFPAAGFAGEQLSIPARFIAKDQFGNAVNSAEGGAVSVLAGGGIASGLTFLGDGVIRPTSWILGPVPGSNQLQVAFGPVSITVVVDAPAASPFNVVLRGVPEEFAPEFGHAAYEWRRRITADIPDLTNVSIAGGQCAGFQQGVSGNVDDLIIDVNIGPIDGVGGILGGATPCFIRTVGHLPLLGVMQFDDADLAQLKADGTLGDVILHEMGHVLGIGSLWATDSLIINAGTISPQYIGAGGEQGWLEIGGGPTGSVTVPVENTGPAGTRDVHWRESVMPSELMTGYLSALVNPMSAVTVRSLADLGYTVDPSTADPYAVFTAPSPTPRPAPVRIRDLVGGPMFEIDQAGRVKRIH